MPNLKCIHFAYFPKEAEIPVVIWCLKRLDKRLAETGAMLVVSDMKFGRGGMEVSWDLTGAYSDELESALEQEIEWMCRRATKAFDVGDQ